MGKRRGGGFLERIQKSHEEARIKQESGETPTYYNGITGKLTHVHASGRYVNAMINNVSVSRAWAQDKESVEQLKAMIGQDVFTTVHQPNTWSPHKWFQTIQPIGNRKLERL